MSDVLGLQTFDLEGLPELRERLVVSPCAGRFHPLPPETITTEGEWVTRGQVIAQVHDGSRPWPVESFFEGWLMGMLTLPGQPVTRGEALFWIRT